MRGISALAEDAVILVPVRGYLAKLLDNDSVVRLIKQQRR